MFDENQNIKDMMAKVYIKLQFGFNGTEFYVIDSSEKDNIIKVTRFIKTSDSTCKSETIESIEWSEGTADLLREKYSKLCKDVRHYITLSDRLDPKKIKHIYGE